MLIFQDQSVPDAIRALGVSSATYCGLVCGVAKGFDFGRSAEGRLPH